MYSNYLKGEMKGFLASIEKNKMLDIEIFNFLFSLCKNI
jgi:hypothetical protein